MKEVEGDFQFNNVTFRYEDGKEDVLKILIFMLKKVKVLRL